MTQPINGTSIGRLLEGTLSSFAQFDNDRQSERTTAGLKEALSQGRWTLPAPLGYAHTGSAHGPSLAHDPERAPLIERVFETYASGRESLQSVADLAAGLGLRSRIGRELDAQAVRRLLANPAYSGQIVVPKWEIASEGDFAPIVSRELFEAVKLAPSGRGGAPVPHTLDHEDFPLRRFVRCAWRCTPMTGSWSKGRRTKYAYYRCRHRACTGDAERRLSVRKEELKGRFLELVGELQPRR